MKKYSVNAGKSLIKLKISIVTVGLIGFASCSQRLAVHPPLKPQDPNGALISPAPNALPVSDVIQKPNSSLHSLQIIDIAGKSQCSKFSFASRGVAPAGYVKGMALSYARSLCRIKASGTRKPAAIVMMLANTLNPKKDVLAHYQDTLAPLGLQTNLVGEEPLLATYTIGMGLAMRESSGKYCEGWDVSAGTNRKSDEAEAGLFQFSLNSMSASSELKRLYDEYQQADPKRCLLDVYKQGVSCRTQSILGTGAGAEFQTFVKKCPAFATEYAMTLVRKLRTHFGPLNRKEAQVVPVCESLFAQVQTLVNNDPESVCAELF